MDGSKKFLVWNKIPKFYWKRIYTMYGCDELFIEFLDTQLNSEQLIESVGIYRIRDIHSSFDHK